MADPTVRGRFVWHELMTTDTKSAGSFYSKVGGWNTKPWENDPSYTMFLAKESPMAGLMTLPDEAKAGGTPPNWLTYIGTPNVDETARHATTLGGKVLKQPEDIPTIGRFAILQDPQGAVFAAFTPLQGPQPESDPVLGDYSWHELMTTDWPAALKFYQSLFGWEEQSSMDMGPEMGMYQMYGRNGKMLGGMFNKPAEQPGPPVWIPYIKVPDSKQAAATAKKLGGQIVSGPMEVPGGDWIAQGIDPQGALFAVHSSKPAATKAPAAAKAPAATKAPAAAKTATRAASSKSARKAKPSKARPAAARAGSRKAASRKVAGRKAASRKAVGRKAVSRKAASRKVVGRKASGRKAVSRKAVSRKAAGRKAVRGKKAKAAARKK
jgi:predicted enzyme related to lactoylglutathione lyase